MRGKPTDNQWRLICEAVNDRHVHDFGSGEGGITHMLSKHAATVVAVDKNNVFARSGSSVSNIEWIEAWFEDYNTRCDEVDVAFISWPLNHRDVALYSLLKRARTIIYLGKNTDGIVCGFPDMFRMFAWRDLLAHIPDRHNTLLILGDPLQRVQERDLTGEEYAGLTAYDGPILKYEDIKDYRYVTLTALDNHRSSRS